MVPRASTGLRRVVILPHALVVAGLRALPSLHHALDGGLEALQLVQGRDGLLQGGMGAGEWKEESKGGISDVARLSCSMERAAAEK